VAVVFPSTRRWLRKPLGVIEVNMFGGLTKHEIRVLAACHVWYKHMGDKPSTDILWSQVRAMCEPRLTKRAADSPKAGGKSAKRKVVKAKVIRPAKSG